MSQHANGHGFPVRRTLEDMKEGGYVRIWRRIWWSDSMSGNWIEQSLWAYMISMCEFKRRARRSHGKTPREVWLEPGEMLTSLTDLARKSGRSRKSIATFLKRLETTRRVKITSVDRDDSVASKRHYGIIIKILNYKDYQGMRDDAISPDEHPSANSLNEEKQEGKEASKKERTYLGANATVGGRESEGNQFTEKPEPLVGKRTPSGKPKGDIPELELGQKVEPALERRQPASNSAVKQPPPSPPARKKPRTALPEDWEPSAKGRAFAMARGMPARGIADQVVKFRANHESRGSVMASWDAAWRTWAINYEAFGAATARPTTWSAPVAAPVRPYRDANAMMEELARIG